MPHRIICKTVRIEKIRKVKYTKQKEEAINVTQFIDKINNINVSPKHLRELGLPSNWQKEVSDKFIEKVVKTAERYRKDLKELSKR